MSDPPPPNNDPSVAYWKQEAIKHEQKYRRLRERNQELESKLTGLLKVSTVDEALRTVQELSEATKDWPTLMDELEGFRAKKAELDKDAVVGEYRKKLATRDRRDEWLQAIKDELNDGVPIEDVWAKAGYEPGEEPVGEALKELVAKARESAGYLFKPPAGAGVAADAAKAVANGTARPTPREPGPGLSRGAPEPPTYSDPATAARARLTQSNAVTSNGNLRLA